MSLHELLRRERAALIRRFEERVRAEGPARSLPTPELLDTLPEFLDHLGEVLEAKEGEPVQVSPRIPREHGSQRLRLGFDVGSVVWEYGMLEQCLLELAREAGAPLSLSELAALARYIDAARVEAARQYARQRDLQQKRIVSEHLDYIAHDLRDQIACLLMTEELLRRETPSVVESRAFERLHRCGRRLASFVDAAISRSEGAPSLVLKRERLRLRPLLEEILDELRPEAEAKQLTLSLELPPGVVLEADPRLLRSIVINLARNAVRFSRPGGAVELRARPQDGGVALEVEDGCGGLDPSMIEELSAPASPEGTTRGGLSLGLSITRRATEAHGGTLRAMNLPGKGCVFIACLPGPQPTREALPPDDEGVSASV